MSVFYPNEQLQFNSHFKMMLNMINLKENLHLYWTIIVHYMVNL